MANDTDLHDLVPWQPGPKTRGGYSIIWSCVALIITCTWTSLHLNVPGIYDTAWTQLRRKIKWMLVMIIFPEFIFSRAVVELTTAILDYQHMWEKDKDNELRRLGWCTHPSKGIMWIALFLSGRPVWPWKLWRAAQVDTDVDLEPAHATASMKRPKNRAFHPIITDPGWRMTTLPLKYGEDCEVHNSRIWTLMHSFYVNMGGFVMRFGHKKKRLVCQASQLHSKGHNFILARLCITQAEILDKSKGDTLVRLLWLLQMVRLLLDLAARQYKAYPISPFEIITASFAAVSSTIVMIQIKKPLDIRTPTCLEAAECLQNNPFEHIAQERWKSFAHFFFNGDSRSDLGNFRRRTNDSYREDAQTEALLFSMLFMSTIIFGLIHCAAWNYAFSSVAEKWIWRVAALSGIVMPIVALLCVLSLYELSNRIRSDKQRLFNDAVLEANFFEVSKQNFRREKVKSRIWSPLQVMSLVLHLVSRIALIVIALMSFRSAPRGVYLDTWAAFIPTLQ